MKCDLIFASLCTLRRDDVRCLERKHNYFIAMLKIMSVLAVSLPNRKITAISEIPEILVKQSELKEKSMALKLKITYIIQIH